MSGSTDSEHRASADPSPGSGTTIPHSSDIATHLPLQQDKSANRVLSNVPFRRNPNFFARDAELAAIGHGLSETGIVVLASADGVGGIGRAQLALEYAYASAKKYRMIWWLRGPYAAVLEENLAHFAAKLELAADHRNDLPAELAAARTWLETNDRWLLVFDNVATAETAMPYLPQERRGHVMIIPAVASALAGQYTVHLEPFSGADAAGFLKRITKRDDDAGALSELLRGFPLALALAGAYIRETGTPIREYVSLLSNSLGPGTKPLNPHHAKFIVRAVLELSLNEIGKMSTASRDIFARCAFMAHHDIPVLLPPSGREFLSPQLAELMADQRAFSEALTPLVRFELIARVGESLFVHPLVQTVTREGMTEEPNRAWAGAAIASVERVFPAKLEQGYPEPQTAQLLPHALVSVRHAQEAQVGLDRCASVLNQVALYLHDRNQLQKARRYGEESLSATLELYGEVHPATAMRVNALGVIHQDAGNLAEARACFERAFEICESVYGPTGEAVYSKVDFSMLTMPVRNLCSVLKEAGDSDTAREVYERALNIFLTVYGPKHSVVAECANHLGSFWHEAGDIERAGTYFEQAVDAETNSEEPIKGNLAIYLNNLGSLLFKKGKTSKARKRFERALALDKADFGSASSKVATDLANIAQTYRAQGKNAEAHKLYKEAFAILNTGNHADADTLHIVLRHLSKSAHNSRAFTEARPYFERLVSLSAQIYGDQSAEFSIDSINYARFLEDAKDFATAREYLERTLAIEEHIEGPRTERAATLHQRIGGVMQLQGELSGALEHCKRALDIDTELHGEMHESVARDSYYLGCLLVEMDDALTGMGHIAHAAKLYETTLGKDHPKTRRARSKLADISG